MDLAYPVMEPWTMGTALALGSWIFITLVRIRKAQ